MVLPNQYLERPALIACGDLTLEGLYHRGEKKPPLLVCPPPGEGGGMDAPPVAELAWACARAKHASLRFQHRGFGASQGERDDARRVEDAEAAWQLLAETAQRPKVAVAGYLGGCDTALALARAHSECAAVVLLAPLAAPDLAGVSAPVRAILPERGDAALAAAIERALQGRGDVVRIPGADDRFRVGLPQVGKLVVQFIERSLPA